MNSQLVEIASWRIVSELYRRHPDCIKVIETHPGGGLYDCLSIFAAQNRHMADFNRAGRFHVFQRFDGSSDTPEPLDIWPAMLNEPTPVSVLDQVCRMLGLAIPEHRPASTPTTLVYRFIASFLGHQVFGTIRWECRSGVFDTSGYGGGVSDRFAKFPQARERLSNVMPGDLLAEPVYRFWFLLADGNPRLCLETTGRVWDDRGNAYRLMDLYQEAGRRIGPLVCQVAGYLLP